MFYYVQTATGLGTMAKRLALVDGDTIAYRCAASCEPSKKKADELGIPLEQLQREPLDIAIQRADELIYRILSDTQSEEYRVFLTGSGNFRKKLYPDYKANREKLVRPEWLEPVRQFLVEEWKATVCSGYEADDAIAIAAGEGTIICAHDKDFRQLKGEHYNFVKSEFFTVTPLEAEMAFWSQMLIGDPSDHVRGVDGIGPVKARRYLAGLDPGEMAACVFGLYNNREQFDLNYRLFRLVRSEEELERILDEAAKRESEREKPSEAGSAEDLSPFQTINS